MSIPNSKRLPAGALALLLLAGCAGRGVAPTPPASAPPPISDAEIQTLIEAGEIAAAADAYDVLAAASASPLKEDYRLRAVELLFEHALYAQAVQRLAAIEAEGFPPELEVRRRLLEAHAALEEGQPEEALRRLPEATPSTPLADEARIYELRAQALETLERTSEALHARIALEPLLDSPEAIERNHARLWQVLAQPGLVELAALRQAQPGEVFRGWVELAEAVRGARLEQSSLAGAINGWLRRNPGHPAADSFAIQMLDSMLADRSYPHQIALLLPLRGRYAQVAGAVRDGFLAAYLDAPDDEQKPEVRIYDLGEDLSDFWNVYNRALGEGARLVVGPLSKDAVNLLAAAGTLPAPVLSLNYTDDPDALAPAELFQFGLLPEDEARQAAEFVLASGLHRAIAMVPEGAWGERLLAAFRENLEAGGGALIDHELYAARENDFTPAIERLLALQLSESRKRVLQRTVGTGLEFEPRRREDVEAIFLAAAPKNARLIKPQLRFHRAGDIPVYATSHVFSGVRDTRADKDMDGLVYLDIPLLLDSRAQTDALRERLLTAWPATAERHMRLFALGMDAYHVIPHLERLRENPDLTFGGLTGDLFMDTGRRLHRRLRWGLFEDGEPRPLRLTPLPEPARGPSLADTSAQQ